MQGEHLLRVGFWRIFAVAVAAACLSALSSTGRAADGGATHASRRVVPDTTSAPVQTPPVAAGQRASGAVFIGYRGSDGATTGAVATLSPVWSTFMRVGAEITQRSPDGDARFLWGIGFEDARDRTLFLHVHDWGPVRPERRFTVRNAEASLGYKLPRVRGGPFRLATSAFATLPFDGDPYLGARATVAIGWSWFVSTAFGWTLRDVVPSSADSPDWLLSFALGRWDGRPGGLFVTYRDELSSREYGEWKDLVRQGRGILALGVNWAH